MNFAIIRGAILGLALAVGLSFSSSYAEEGSNVAEKGDVAPRSAVEQLMLAQQIYAYGVEDEDPLLVIAAARLMANTPVEDVERAAEETPIPDDEGGAGEQEQSASGGDQSLPDLAAMIATGRELAGDQQVLHAMLDDIEASKTKGVLTGKRRDNKIISARSRHRYYGDDTTYRGGYRAEVGIAGSGYADLDLYVYDENGNEICKSIGGSDREFCSWTPRWTGPFQIVVVNNSYQNVRYVIWTN